MQIIIRITIINEEYNNLMFVAKKSKKKSKKGALDFLVFCFFVLSLCGEFKMYSIGILLGVFFTVSSKNRKLHEKKLNRDRRRNVIK